ncbi:hypothetical protein D3C84_907650 [compost metagenome]
MRGRGVLCLVHLVALCGEHGAVQHTDAKPKIAGTLEQPAVPAQGDVVGDAAAGCRVVDTQGALLGLSGYQLRRLAQRRAAALAFDVVAHRLQLSEQAIQPEDGELDGVSHDEQPCSSGAADKCRRHRRDERRRNRCLPDQAWTPPDSFLPS